MFFTKKPYDKVRSPSLKALILSVEEYLNLRYTFRCEKRYQGFFGRMAANADRQEEEARESGRTQEHWWEPRIYASDPYALEIAIARAKEAHRTDNFSLALMRLIEEKGLNAVDVYRRANMDRKLFSKIKTNHDYIPSKRTILALAIALELSLEETQALLRKGGYSLSNSILLDVIVEFFISQGKYSMEEINAVLYAYDLTVF